MLHAGSYFSCHWWQRVSSPTWPLFLSTSQRVPLRSLKIPFCNSEKPGLADHDLACSATQENLNLGRLERLRKEVFPATCQLDS